MRAEKAWLAHRHLFALKLARNAHNRDDDISILRGLDRFRRRRIVRLGPDQLCVRLAVSGAVRNFENDLVALLKMNAADLR